MRPKWARAAAVSMGAPGGAGCAAAGCAAAGGSAAETGGRAARLSGVSVRRGCAGGRARIFCIKLLLWRFPVKTNDRCAVEHCRQRAAELKL